MSTSAIPNTSISYITVNNANQKGSMSIKPSQFEFSLSNELNLAIIRGTLDYTNSSELAQSLDHISDHLRFKDRLNIYVRIDNVDDTGASYLLSLISLLNKLNNESKDINVYWNREYSEVMEVLAEELKEITTCGFRYSKI